MAFAAVLALVVSTLGVVRTSSWVSSDPAAPARLAAQLPPAADAVPDVDAWDLENDGDDGDDNEAGDDHAAPRSELPFSLPPLGASTQCRAALASLYQSFVSEPSTPPPRA